MKISGKEGGISIFIVLILPALIMLLLFTVERTDTVFKEYQIKSALRRQCDLILSQYDDVVYDRYGLFGVRVIDDRKCDFDISVKDIRGVSDYCVVTENELTDNVLYNEIVRFSKVRFPVHASVQFLDWISTLADEKSKITKLIEETGNKKLTGIGDISDSNEFNAVYDLISSVITDDSLDAIRGELWDSDVSGSDISERLKKYENNSNELSYIDFTQYNGLSLSDIAGRLTEKLGIFLLSDSAEIYKRASFEYYAAEMFSCRTDNAANDDNIPKRRNLRGISFDDLNSADMYETEKIVFGSEDPGRNKDLAQTIICSTRFITNLLVCIFDPVKSGQIKTAAASISSVIAVASCGTAPIPPETIEGVLMIIIAACESMDDWDLLSKGESIQFIPAKGFEKLQLTYRDHLRIMLLCVPADIKLERMSRIIKGDAPQTKSGLFTKIKTTCLYKGKRYVYEDSYFG